MLNFEEAVDELGGLDAGWRINEHAVRDARGFCPLAAMTLEKDAGELRRRLATLERRRRT